MAIPESKYIQITSAVGAGVTVQSRSLSTRIFTQNTLAPTGGRVLEFTSADAVRAYFGGSSQEYYRALFYFSFISKNITKPLLISFYRWTPADTAPQITGGTHMLLSALQAVTAGSFNLTIGETTHQITGIDLSDATSLADVADIMQDAVQAADVDVMWSSATFIYNNTTNKFILTGGDTTTTDSISVAIPTSGDDISALLGFYPTSTYPAGAIWSPGQAAQTAPDVLEDSLDNSENFGSYLFLNPLSSSQCVAVAQAAQAANQIIMGLQEVTADDAAEFSNALGSIQGVALTLSPITTEFPEMLPGMIEAATNYDAPNSTQNYMYQQVGGLTPSVTTAADAAFYDSLNVNYYGQTQSNGQKISFYQNGLLSGRSVSTDITDMNVFANEAWLKDAAKTALFRVLLALPKISANKFGRGQLIAVMQTVVNRATANGTISVGAELTEEQKLFVTQVTNDDQAWHQVQNIGFWMDVVIVPYVQDGNTLYKAVYTLVYKKDDVIRRIEGSNILI